MSTPFIIYYLYTFNDLATIRTELTSLLGQAYEGMKDNFILPEEFEHHQLPKINIRRRVPKLPGQSGEKVLQIHMRHAGGTVSTLD
jgi:hypothetical protein